MISISPAQLEQITDAAQRAYPREACGLIVGQRFDAEAWRISEIIESPNILAGGAADRFEVDPRLRIDTERRLRDEEDAVIGHYHSHPDHPAWPSDTDLKMAFEPELVWLIVATSENGPGEYRAFKLNHLRDGFDEIRIIEG